MENSGEAGDRGILIILRSYQQSMGGGRSESGFGAWGREERQMGSNICNLEGRLGKAQVGLDNTDLLEELVGLLGGHGGMDNDIVT